jgi:hypothetical protein
MSDGIKLEDIENYLAIFSEDFEKKLNQQNPN